MRQQVSYNYTDWLKAYGYIMSTNNTVCRNSVAQSTAKSVLLHHHTNSCRWLLFSVAHTSRTPSKPKSALCHSWVNRSLLFTRWIGSEVAVEIGIQSLTQVNEHYYYESVPIVHRPPVSDYESSLLMSSFKMSRFIIQKSQARRARREDSHTPPACESPSRRITTAGAPTSSPVLPAAGRSASQRARHCLRAASRAPGGLFVSHKRNPKPLAGGWAVQALSPRARAQRRTSATLGCISTMDIRPK